MTPAVRVGTRASALALTQTTTVAESLAALGEFGYELVRVSTTGDVNAWIDLSSLFPRAQRMPPADELNGIAYDKATRRIFITGKKWPRLYQITVS